jgi:cell division protein FtsW (lipid II flippase)
METSGRTSAAATTTRKSAGTGAGVAAVTSPSAASGPIHPRNDMATGLMLVVVAVISLLWLFTKPDEDRRKIYMAVMIIAVCVWVLFLLFGHRIVVLD